ncbi:MAG: tetratricopeptide repeat protein [Acidobacteriota bacterium]|nr:tetratricopeptide repeat protein [Acidobacteriota bacterium]
MKTFLTMINLLLSAYSLAQSEKGPRPLDPYKELDTAYAMLKLGNLEACLELVEKGLSRGWGPSWDAPYTYIKGFALGRMNGKNSEAIETLLDARKLYNEIEISEYFTEEDRITNLRQVDSGLAKLYLDAGEHEAAQGYLDRLTAEGEKPSGYTYFLSARLLFEKKQYDEALAEAYESRDTYETPGEKAQTTALIGMLLMVTGDYEAGLKETLKSQKGIIQDGDMNHYYYSLANMVLYHRCKYGAEPEETIRTIEAYLEDHSDLNLERTLNFVKNFECP